MIKYGRRDGRQRYLCKECFSVFTGGDKLQADQLWELYQSGLTYLQIATRIGVSQSTVKRLLKKIQVDYERPCLSGGVIHIDVTYWGRNKGLIVALDASTGMSVYHKWITHESKQDYLDALSAIKQSGYQIKAVVLDGGVGLSIAFNQLKVQMCQYHFISIIRRKLTLRPKLPASQELLSLVKSVTYLPKEDFIRQFTEWKQRWGNFLKEKTINEETSK